ncbi:hypothetical protein V8C35DRAFT_285917 [Trichoderma chlorosporum]
MFSTARSTLLGAMLVSTAFCQSIGTLEQCSITLTGGEGVEVQLQVGGAAASEATYCGYFNNNHPSLTFTTAGGGFTCLESSGSVDLLFDKRDLNTLTTWLNSADSGFGNAGQVPCVQN